MECVIMKCTQCGTSNTVGKTSTKFKCVKCSFTQPVWINTKPKPRPRKEKKIDFSYDVLFTKDKTDMED